MENINNIAPEDGIDCSWNDMYTYFEGDLNSVMQTWPKYDPPYEGSTEAPNGWGGAREYYEAHGDGED